MKKIAVIGAGPAGLTAAYKLAKYGMEVSLYEAEAMVGGMSKTLKLWGQKVDLGPHRFFSSDRRVNDFWLEVVQTDYSMLDRLSRIYYNKKFFHYPLKPADALFNLGFFEAARCIISYFLSSLRAKAQNSEESTFETWVTERFGRRLYEIFFKTYSEKLWGISCNDLDSDFASQRIKKLSLMSAVWNSIVGGKGSKHKTLIEQFAYPHGGSGSVWEKMAEKFRRMGGALHLSTKVSRVLNNENFVIGIQSEDSTAEQYDHVISTMPLSTMVESLNGTPSEVLSACHKLTYRNTILVYLEIDNSRLFPDNWIYVHSADIFCGRITNFRNWTPELYANRETTIICLEYWTNFEEPLWEKSETELGDLARKEIQKTGIAGDSAILNHFVFRIPRSYPVYAKGYKRNLNIIVRHLRTLKGLTVIGRYGSFKYNNQDHSILMGLLAAENIAENANHDLWQINTDDEYQEKAKITASGLEFST